MLQWLKQLWTGDDGKDYAICVEPSTFRADLSSVNGPFTRRIAFQWARRYVARHPFGLCEITSHKRPMRWPPRTTWDPPEKKEQHPPVEVSVYR